MLAYHCYGVNAPFAGMAKTNKIAIAVCDGTLRLIDDDGILYRQHRR